MSKRRFRDNRDIFGMEPTTKIEEITERKGILASRWVRIRKEPNTQSDLLCVKGAGEEVVIVGDTSERTDQGIIEFYKIQLEEDVYGYVRKDLCEEILV